MTKDWAIRIADAKDSDRLALVGAATFLESFAGILDGDAIVAHCAKQHGAGVYREYLSGGGQAWLAEMNEGGAPIGYTLVTKPDLPGHDPDGGDLELKRIYLFSRFHGTGLGSALLDPAVEQASAAGAGQLLLGVYAKNLRAIAFYNKHGFAQVGERMFQVGDQQYYDAVLAKPL